MAIVRCRAPAERHKRQTGALRSRPLVRCVRSVHRALQMKALWDATGPLWASGALVGKPVAAFTSGAAPRVNSSKADKGRCDLMLLNPRQVQGGVATLSSLHTAMRVRVLGPVFNAGTVGRCAAATPVPALPTPRTIEAPHRAAPSPPAVSTQGGGIETTIMTALTQFVHHVRLLQLSGERD